MIAQDTQALAEALRPALLRVSRRLRQEAQRAGISALDALILGQIQHQPGIGVCGLADAEQMARPTMSSHIKRFQAQGWVSRTDDAIDGRRSGLAITDQGRAQLDAIRQLRNDWLAARLDRLEPNERTRLAEAAAPLLALLSAAT